MIAISIGLFLIFCLLIILFFNSLLITSIVIAAKFFDDHYFANSHYAKVGGITNKELNNLEFEFLNSINYTLYVTSE